MPDEGEGAKAKANSKNVSAPINLGVILSKNTMGSSDSPNHLVHRKNSYEMEDLIIKLNLFDGYFARS